MKSSRILLIYNPNSGNGVIRENLDYIIGRIQRKRYLVIPYRISKKDFLGELFANMDVSRYKKVIIAGGDGTINRVINHMIDHDIDLPIAIFPSGTANDFAYYFDIPLQLDAMIDTALQENYTYADIGKVNDKYFVNVAAMGFMVDVSQKTDPDVKEILGKLSYYLKGLGELPNLRPIPMKITSAEYSSEENIFFMLVMNGKSAGGFKKIAPDASVNDGLLDIIIFKKMPIANFMPLLVEVLTGRHEENKNIICFKTDRLYLETDQDIGTDIDGEKAPSFPLEFTVLPKYLKVTTRDTDMQGNLW